MKFFITFYAALSIAIASQSSFGQTPKEASIKHYKEQIEKLESDLRKLSYEAQCRQGSDCQVARLADPEACAPGVIYAIAANDSKKASAILSGIYGTYSKLEMLAKNHSIDWLTTCMGESKGAKVGCLKEKGSAEGRCVVNKGPGDHFSSGDRCPSGFETCTSPQCIDGPKIAEQLADKKFLLPEHRVTRICTLAVSPSSPVEFSEASALKKISYNIDAFANETKLRDLIQKDQAAGANR